jgi:NADPH2:quinone reductase
VAVGPDVTALAAGDRVAYIGSSPGSYTTHRVLPANRLLKLPDAISTEVAAATLLKGMTACILVEDCAKVQPGQTVLVHAAAGGVGSLLVPWLVDRGAHVIAHSGNAEKAAEAKANGAQESLHCSFDDLAEEVKKRTGGTGVDVVIDGVGKASWIASLASLRRRGLMVVYGNASGPVPPFNVLDLSRGGSLFVTRPTLFDYTHSEAELRDVGSRLFDRLARGIIKADIRQRYALTDAADAHRALEARQTMGSTILLPNGL